ncbi:hypothetical protein F5Y14DRAFT_452570 [Nemania sp. NC0429]|nr:hypothetical protein F5Y14DRAFT_452570 [Nemania sp. NC0429]
MQSRHGSLVPTDPGGSVPLPPLPNPPAAPTNRFEEIYSPSPDSKFGINVDIVAINGDPTDPDLTWVFHPRAQNSRGRSFSTVERMWESGSIDSARNFVKEAFNPAKQTPESSQQGVNPAQASQQATRKARRQPGNRTESPDIHLDRLPSTNAKLKPRPSRRVRDESLKVNWLKDLLPISFPNTRIVQYSFQPSLEKWLVASLLANELRADDAPSLSRPIIFIAHGPISNVLGDVLAMDTCSALVATTVGFAIFGQEYQEGSLTKLAKTCNIPLTYFYGTDMVEDGWPLHASGYIQREKFDRKSLDVAKFQNSEDPNYLRVKNTLNEYINFTATRRLWEAISNQVTGVAEVQSQISKGADVDRKNAQGRTALHLAIKANNLDKVKLLLENNAEVNTKDNEGHSPITQAIQQDNYEIARALLERGALVEEEDKSIAKTKDSGRGRGISRQGSNLGMENLLGRVTYFAGPRVRRKNEEATKPAYDNIPDNRRNAARLFDATVMTFELRPERKSATDSDEENEREYHTTETVSVYDLLYEEGNNQYIDDSLSEKKWKWYHFPANNMDWALFFQLKVDNEDGRLSGQEHRGRFPHTLFLQPQANVFDQGQRGRRKTALFMPYLHSETNEGRARLRNAIQRTVGDRKDHERDSSSAPISVSTDDDDSDNDDDDDDNEDEDGSDNSGDDDDHVDHVDGESDVPSNSRSKEYQLRAKPGQKASPFKKKFKTFQKKINVFQHNLREGKRAGDRLISAYFARENHTGDNYTRDHRNHLHIRRTLDQFYYINVADTGDRDMNQVVQRYAVKEKDSMASKREILSSALIMVDQLWLWVLEEKHIIITAFPQEWFRGRKPKDSSMDLLERIEKHLRNRLRQPITSVEELSSVIIKQVTGAFGHRFLDMFDASISDADRNSKIYERLYNMGWDDEPDLKTTQKENKKDKKSKKNAPGKAPLSNSELNIAEEIELLVEIQDIQDELNIIKMVLDEQYSVVTVPRDGGDGDSKYKENISHDTFPTVDGKAVDYYTVANRKTIERMRLRAEEVHRGVHHLIDLKQKQANLDEARYARIEANSAAKGGQTILALTIVNMLFVTRPVSSKHGVKWANENDLASAFLPNQLLRT